MAEVANTHGVEGSKEELGDYSGTEESRETVLHLEGGLVGEGYDAGRGKRELNHSRTRRGGRVKTRWERTHTIVEGSSL